MLCLFDPAQPVNVIDRAASRFCPAGKFIPDDPRIEAARNMPLQPIPEDYQPTPIESTAGGCGCKK